MKRIFASLAVVGTAAMLATFVLGWLIGDPASHDIAERRMVDWHMLSALGALIFASLVHAIVLTYFMGTGRWLEETSQAYRLGDRWTAGGSSLKYRTLPWMAVGLLLLILTGGLGAVADPAAAGGAKEFFGIPSATVHLLIASLALVANAVINVAEYSAIAQNSMLIDEVLVEVHRIRREKGLPVE